MSVSDLSPCENCGGPTANENPDKEFTYEGTDPLTGNDVYECTTCHAQYES